MNGLELSTYAAYVLERRQIKRERELREDLVVSKLGMRQSSVLTRSLFVGFYTYDSNTGCMCSSRSAPIVIDI